MLFRSFRGRPLRPSALSTPWSAGTGQAGLQKAHYGTTVGTLFRKDGQPYQADFAAVARAYGAEGVKIESAAEFKEVLERAVKSNKPFVIDVAMKNNPVPTTGHWNILDIYSPEGGVSHVSTD